MCILQVAAAAVAAAPEAVCRRMHDALSFYGDMLLVCFVAAELSDRRAAVSLAGCTSEGSHQVTSRPADNNT